MSERCKTDYEHSGGACIYCVNGEPTKCVRVLNFEAAEPDVRATPEMTLREYSRAVAARVAERFAVERKTNPVLAINVHAMQLMAAAGLPNVTDNVYVINDDGITPNHYAQTLEYTLSSGYQLRVMSSMCSTVGIPYRDVLRFMQGQTEAVDVAAHKAIRRMVQAQLDACILWFAANPEDKT